jgi:hypothetical protein
MSAAAMAVRVEDSVSPPWTENTLLVAGSPTERLR